MLTPIPSDSTSTHRIVADNDHPVLIEGQGATVTVRGLQPNEPALLIERKPGHYPRIIVRDLTIDSDGSGIRLVRPGASTRLENVHVKATGRSLLDLDGWSDLDTAGYALKVEEADGLFVSGFSAVGCGGHGVIAKRWHAGSYQGRVRECLGTGFKGQLLQGLNARFWCESNEGWGVDVRRCTLEHFGQTERIRSGAGSRWDCWLEANNGRGTPHTRSGHTFPQFRLDGCAVDLAGHSGWSVNAGMVDSASRQLSVLDHGPAAPNRDADIGLSDPASTPGEPTADNWGTVWPDKAFRPTVSRRADALRITWPAYSFNRTRNASDIAWWRPWPDSHLKTPGTFYYRVTVQAATEIVPNYCHRRLAAADRQTPIVGVFVLQPVGAAIHAFALWDMEPVTLTGVARIDWPTDRQVSIGFNAWTPGMQNKSGDPAADQSEPMAIDILEMELWKL
jgi:hypothetical protein